MKHLLIVVMFCGCLVGPVQAGPAHDDLFTLSWGSGPRELGLKVIPLGGVSHEKGFFTLRYGPTALAVSPAHVIYILDRLHDRVLVFNPAGKLLRTLEVPPGLRGLAVSASETLVAFDPLGRYVLGLTGKLAGRKIQAPDTFGALSEVWFAGEALWARYDRQVVCLNQRGLEAKYAHGICVGPDEVAMSIYSASEQPAYVTLSVRGHFQNVYATGAVRANDTVTLAMISNTNKRERTVTLLFCNPQGRASELLRLSPCWTHCFWSYSITPDGKVYEMVIEKQGVTIRCWQPMELKRQIKLRSNVPAEMLVPPLQAPIRSSRATINVWFRDTGQVKTVDLEEYLKGVVSKEIYSSWPLEAQKAMAVVARTYAVARYRHPEHNAHVCTSTCCQAWTPYHNSNAIAGVNATAGKYVVKNGRRISEPLYFSHCNGHTRNSEDYDSWSAINYLRRVSCPCGWSSYYGHGVGLCQYGMKAYADRGYNYVQIIQHYYTGCSVGY